MDKKFKWDIAEIRLEICIVSELINLPAKLVIFSQKYNFTYLNSPIFHKSRKYNIKICKSIKKKPAENPNLPFYHSPKNIAD